MNQLLLSALKCENTDRPPVWLMRQAGRYLPEYRKLREKQSLWSMFHDPEVAAKVTHLPVDLLGVDAAILFSDILVIGEALGLRVHFPEGQGPYIETPPDLSTIQPQNVEEALAYVAQTIRLLKPTLKVPLIGFSGAPFTVASYMIDKGGKGELKETKKWISRDPAAFHILLEKITKVTIAYLEMQIKAGVDAIQIFDSWAGVLSYAEFPLFSTYYLKRIVDALKPYNIPIILFCRGSCLYVDELVKANPSCISFDSTKPLSEVRKFVPSSMAIQGNLDPYFLYSPKEKIKAKVTSLIHSLAGDKGLILNLGHGVFPDIPVDHVQCFIDTVKEAGATCPPVDP